MQYNRHLIELVRGIIVWSITINKDKGISMKKNFIREKKIFCGKSNLEVDIFPMTEDKRVRKGKRSKKKKLSAPKQRNLNDKNAKRYLVQVVNTNFSWGDLKVSLTYKDSELPKTLEDGQREVTNFRDRINRRRKKEGLPPGKFIVITEGTVEKGGPRLHHHMFMSGGLDRDTVESLWCRRRKKGEKEGKRIGFANADRLHPDDFGLEALARYLTKDPQGKKRWSGSQNLDKPVSRDNDHKYKKRQIETAIRNDDKQFWEKQYPEYWLTEYKPVYNEFTGWSVYLKLRKRE